MEWRAIFMSHQEMAVLWEIQSSNSARFQICRKCTEKNTGGYGSKPSYSLFLHPSYWDGSSSWYFMGFMSFIHQIYQLLGFCLAMPITAVRPTSPAPGHVSLLVPAKCALGEARSRGAMPVMKITSGTSGVSRNDPTNIDQTIIFLCFPSSHG